MRWPKVLEIVGRYPSLMSLPCRVAMQVRPRAGPRRSIDLARRSSPAASSPVSSATSSAPMERSTAVASAGLCMQKDSTT